MIIREFRKDDLAPIDALWKKHHQGIRGIPENKHLFSEAVVEHEGKIVAYGMGRYFAEALMFADYDVSAYKRAKAFMLMMGKVIEDSKKAGLDYLHIGTSDADFQNILEKKYHLTDRGIVLALGLD